MKYNKIFVFLFILICFTSIAYSADETLNNVFNEANDFENIENNENLENTDNNNINNIEEELIEEDYEDNPITDNNFEDGYEHSEIIELNDTTIYSDDNEIITNTTHPTSRPNRAASNNNNIQTPIVSASHSYISAKVALKKITDTTYNTTFIVTDNCSVYYTLNGNNPTTASTKYTKAFIYNTSKTLKYFAISKDGDKGPVLSMKLSEGTTPYIAYKTPITNKIQTIYLSYTLPQTKIYYTLNGSTPTNKSSEYTKALNINNNTKLKFIAVYGTKTTPVYQYIMNAVKPTVTIKNTTDVRNNYQNITIKINKPGKIYYTRNGSNPTNQSNTWTNNTNVMISIKTQVRTILIDNEGFTSDITYYQPPKIITPPITAIRPITTLINNIQKIQFSTNQQNSTIYYTTDKTNPLTSNTTKTAKNNDKINLNKNTRLKYYTKDDIQGYKSAVYNYTPVQNANERPTITIINATNIWNNGQQKIIIQSNQPGKFNIKKYNDTNTEEILNNTGSYTSNIKYKLQIYTQHEDKYSKIIEYNPSTSIKTVMNYSYTMEFQFQNMWILLGNTKLYTSNQTVINNLNNGKYYFYNYRLKNTVISNNPTVNENGVLLHKKGNKLVIKYYNHIYGDINMISISKLFNTNNVTSIYAFNNNIRSKIIDLYFYNMNGGKIYYTTFISNHNSEILSKTEILTTTYNSEISFNTIQTYVLTNKLINMNVLKYYMNLKDNYNTNVLKSYYGTYLTALSTIYFYDETSKFFADKLNITFSRQQEAQMLMGVHFTGMTYMTTPDPTLGLSIWGNESNKVYFRLMSTLMLSECERMALQGSGQTTTSAFQIFYKSLNESTLNITYTENTKTIQIIPSVDDTQYKFIIELDTGIVWTYTSNIFETMILGNPEYLKGATTLDGQGSCYHDERTDAFSNALNDLTNYINALGYRMGQENLEMMKDGLELSQDISDEMVSFFEDWAGGAAITAGMTIVLASGGTMLPIVVGAAIVGTGIALCLNAAGADEPSDILNSYYWAQAAPTILESAIVPLGTIRNAAKGLQLLNRIGRPLIKEGGFLIRTCIKINNYESINDFIDTEIRNSIYSYAIDNIYSFFGIEIEN